MLGITLKNLREKAACLVELLQLDVGKALLQRRIGGEFVLVVFGHFTEMQDSRLMFFLGGIYPAEEIVHPNPLRRRPALEGILVLFVLIEKALEGLPGLGEVFLLVGKSPLFGKGKRKVRRGARVEAGEGFQMFESLGGLLFPVVCDGQLNQGGIDVCLGGDPLAVVSCLLDPGSNEGLQGLDTFLPLLLLEVRVAHQEGQLGEQRPFRLAGKEWFGGGEGLIPATLMMMNLGNPECRSEGIGMILMGSEEFLVGLDRIISLTEQEHVLRPQKASVPGHLMVLELGDVFVSKVQAVVVVPEFVVACGPLGQDFRKLPEDSAVDSSEGLGRGLPVGLVATHQCIGIIKAQVFIHRGDVMVFRDCGLKGGGGLVVIGFRRAGKHACKPKVRSGSQGTVEISEP